MAVQIDIKRTVAASPAEAFATVSELLEWPLVIGSIRTIQVLTPGGIREGAQLLETRFLFGRETTQTLEVAQMEPPHRLRLVVQDPDVDFELDHVIDGIIGGGSRLTLIFKSNPQTQAGKAASPFITTLLGITLRDELEQDLLDLSAAITRQWALSDSKTSRGHCGR